MDKILLHIGYPKAGSSFLGNWFEQNPNFMFKDFSFGGFTNTIDLIQKSSKTVACDPKVFVVRDMRFSAPNWYDCEETETINSAQQNIAKLLYSLFPHAKILIVTRGYQSAIKANYSQYLKEGGFLKFNDFFEKNKNSNWLPFNYSYLTQLYSQLFGKENLLVIPFELLNTNADKFIKNIELFLEIPPSNYSTKAKNQSLSPQKMTLIRKLNRIVYTIFFLTGSQRKLLYKKYEEFLDKHKTKTWDNFFTNTFSKLCNPSLLDFEVTPEIQQRFSGFSQALKNNSEFNSFKKEYYID